MNANQADKFFFQFKNNHLKKEYLSFVEDMKNDEKGFWMNIFNANYDQVEENIKKNPYLLFSEIAGTGIKNVLFWITKFADLELLEIIPNNQIKMLYQILNKDQELAIISLIPHFEYEPERSKKIIKRLIEAGVDLNLQDYYGDNMISMLLTKFNFKNEEAFNDEIIQLAEKNNFDFNKPINQENNLLFVLYKSHLNKINVINKLLKTTKINIFFKDSRGNNLMHIASSSYTNSQKIKNLLLNNDCLKILLLDKNNDGFYPHQVLEKYIKENDEKIYYDRDFKEVYKLIYAEFERQNLNKDIGNLVNDFKSKEINKL